MKIILSSTMEQVTIFGFHFYLDGIDKRCQSETESWKKQLQII